MAEVAEDPERYMTRDEQKRTLADSGFDPVAVALERGLAPYYDEGWRRAGPLSRRHRMTLCPIAIAVGCKKCPIFAVCPVKGVIGDYKEEDAPAKSAPARAKGAAKGSAKKRR
jgi:hypothetical protein